MTKTDTLSETESSEGAGGLVALTLLSIAIFALWQPIRFLTATEEARWFLFAFIGAVAAVGLGGRIVRAGRLRIDLFDVALAGAIAYAGVSLLWSVDPGSAALGVLRAAMAGLAIAWLRGRPTLPSLDSVALVATAAAFLIMLYDWVPGCSGPGFSNCHHATGDLMCIAQLRWCDVGQYFAGFGHRNYATEALLALFAVLLIGGLRGRRVWVRGVVGVAALVVAIFLIDLPQTLGRFGPPDRPVQALDGTTQIEPGLARRLDTAREIVVQTLTGQSPRTLATALVEAWRVANGSAPLPADIVPPPDLSQVEDSDIDLAVLPVLLLLAALRFGPRRLRDWRIWLVAGALLGVAAVWVVITYARTASNPDYSVTSRIGLMAGSLAGWAERPVFGHGGGSFEAVLHVHNETSANLFSRNLLPPHLLVPRVASVLVPLPDPDRTPLFDPALRPFEGLAPPVYDPMIAGATHSDPIQLLMEFGLVGLVLFAVPVLMAVFGYLRAPDKTPLEDAAAFVLAGVAWNSFFDFPLQKPATILAVTLALGVLARRVRARTLVAAKLDAVPAGLMTGALLACCALFGFWQSRSFAAQTYLYVAGQNYGRFDPESWALAIRAIDKAYQTWPFNAQARAYRFVYRADAVGSLAAGDPGAIVADLQTYGPEIVLKTYLEALEVQPNWPGHHRRWVTYANLMTLSGGAAADEPAEVGTAFADASETLLARMVAQAPREPSVWLAKTLFLSSQRRWLEARLAAETALLVDQARPGIAANQLRSQIRAQLAIIDGALAPLSVATEIGPPAAPATPSAPTAASVPAAPPRQTLETLPVLVPQPEPASAPSLPPRAAALSDAAIPQPRAPDPGLPDPAPTPGPGGLSPAPRSP